jgi:hypothetical protein
MYELYRATRQDKAPCCSAYVLRQHIVSSGILSRSFSIDDPTVQGWLSNPSSYPEDLKGKDLFLWGSQRVTDKFTEVAYLVWNIDCIEVCWWQLQYCCCGDTRISLLKPANF